MPSASRSTTPIDIDLPVVEGRYGELDEDWDEAVQSRHAQQVQLLRTWP